MIIEGILFSYEIIPRDRSDMALEEVSNLFKKIERELPEAEKAEIMLKPEGVKGLILVDLRRIIEAKSEAEAEEFSRKIREKIAEAFDAGELLSISKIRMIHRIVKTDVEEIGKQGIFFSNYINDKWKIDIHTRKLIDRMEAIRAVASHINMPVDLKKPKYILYIEVLGPSLTVMYLVNTEKIEETILKL